MGGVDDEGFEMEGSDDSGEVERVAAGILVNDV